MEQKEDEDGRPQRQARMPERGGARFPPTPNKIKEDKIMGLRINTNVAAFNAHRQLTKSDSALSNSLERLSFRSPYQQGQGTICGRSRHCQQLPDGSEEPREGPAERLPGHLHAAGGGRRRRSDRDHSRAAQGTGHHGGLGQHGRRGKGEPQRRSGRAGSTKSTGSRPIRSTPAPA